MPTILGTFEVEEEFAGIDVTSDDDDDVDGVIVWELGDVTPRQEVLVPLRMKNGDEVWEVELPEMVADNIYHPWETLTGFQVYERPVGL